MRLKSRLGLGLKGLVHISDAVVNSVKQLRCHNVFVLMRLCCV